MYMYNSTSTEGHTCSAHMTILIPSNIHIHVYVLHELMSQMEFLLL